MTVAEEKNVKTYHLRLPSWLFNWLRDRAETNDHSVAQELRAILRKTHDLELVGDQNGGENGAG